MGCAAFFSAGFFVRSGDVRRLDPPGALRVMVLAVGAGSCNLIELPDGRVIVIDAGSSTMTDPVGRCIEPVLRSRGVRRIEALILSHANYDHFSAAFDLLPLYRVRHVYLAPQFVADAADNPAAGRLVDMLQTRGPPPQFLVAGQSIALGPQTRLEVLWPHEEVLAAANESSLVLRLVHAGRSVLFTGDIESAAQQHLLDDAVDLRADVMISPHHGSHEPTTPAFLRAVGPRTVISSNGRSLSQRQRDFDSLVTVSHLRTHTAGAVTIVIGPDGRLDVTPFHPRRP